VSVTKRSPDPEVERDDAPSAFATLVGVGRDVYRETVVELLSKVLLALGGLGCAAIGALIVSGLDVPAWVAATIVIAAALLVYGARRRIRRLRQAIVEREEHIARLEPDAQVRSSLEERISACEWRLRRHEAYGEHVAEVMRHLQQVIAGAMPDVSLEQFLNRGVLQPACDIMRQYARGEVRLAILRPDGDSLTMPWAAGHNLQGQVRYRVPIEGSLTGLVLKEAVPSLRIWNDVSVEAPFEPQPGATGPFQTLVSQPIRVGEGVAAVFNVTSTVANAFDPAELTYITSLGSVIDLVVELLLREDDRP
jgi:hypothetical protein